MQPEPHFDPDIFRRTIDDKFISDCKNSINDIRISILSLKKRHFKESAVNLLELLEKGHNDKYQLYLMILDMINHKMYKPPPHKRKAPPLIFS